MSTTPEYLEPETPIHLTDGQTEMLLKALGEKPQQASGAPPLSETQFIKRQLEGTELPALEKMKFVVL